MADWARHDKWQRGVPETWARRLKLLRPFTRWLRQFEPRTEVPDEAVFGPVPGRVAPHIYRDDEIVELLAAARRLNPPGSLRPATFETLFGLIAAAGLRVSKALALLDADVDLSAGMLTVRQSKFAKSRRLPLHPSTVEALARYRRLRSRKVRTAAETPFFVGTRGQRLGQPLSEPDHPKALLAQRRTAREQRLLMQFLSLSRHAQVYHAGLEQRRVKPRHHLRKIVALSEIYGVDAVDRALVSCTERQFPAAAPGIRPHFRRLHGPRCGYFAHSLISRCTGIICRSPAPRPMIADAVGNA